MTTYEQGDIILIPFPFTDFSTLKQRSAVVLSSDRFNKTNRDIIVAAITSRIPPEIPVTDYLLSAADLKSGRLPKISAVKLGKVTTIDQMLVRKKLGVLPFSTVAQLLAQFHQIFSS